MGMSFGNVVTGRDETAEVTGWRCVCTLSKIKLQKMYIIADFHYVLNMLPIFTYLAMPLTNARLCVYIFEMSGLSDDRLVKLRLLYRSSAPVD